jgi:hypothetical protein
MMDFLERLDSFWKGLFIGILFPIFLYFLYWLFFHYKIPIWLHIYRLTQFGMLSNIIKICGLGNLLLFYLGLNKKLDKFSKGIIASVVLYAGLVAYVMYFLEPASL